MYADDFAMVQESREVQLKKGINRIGVQDVSKSMDQDSVVYSWPDAKGTSVRSSTYELGTRDTSHLLQRYVGQEVELVYRSETGREAERQVGTLQVAEPGNIVVKVDKKLIVSPAATIEVSTSNGVVTIPQLSAEVESSINKKARMGLSYLTRGLSWSADYTATLAPTEETMSLECWATVTNETGTEFPDAKLSFVAGSPNRAVKPRRNQRAYEDQSVMSESPASGRLPAELKIYGGSPESVGELHAYPYRALATIRPDQMNRVRVMGGEGVKVVRDYAVRLPGIEGSYDDGRSQQRLTATLSLRFKNDKASGLGLPLPGGALRVYEPTSSGNARYIGAATIGDTPTDAEVHATLTDVFDVTAQTRKVASRKIDKRTTARDMEVVVHNEKSHDVEVRLVQDFYGKWKIAKESSPSSKLNANSAQWKVRVPQGKSVKLVYTVHFSW